MLRAYSELCKVKISVFAVLSALSGYFLAPSRIGPDIFLLISGVFVLACGASALNQYQERAVDALMERTRKRPIPSGRIRPVNALYFSMVLIFSGILALFSTGSFTAMILALTAALWYNGAYTYLKRKTAFAVIPGALVGAITPVIGWVMGDGALKDPRLPALCFFFFMWQVPHFWILLLNYGEEYAKAGLPSLSNIFSGVQLRRITFHWFSATAVSCLFLPLYGLVNSPLITFLLFASSCGFLLLGIRFASSDDVSGIKGRAIFRSINYYMLSTIVLVSFGRTTVFW